MRFHKVLIFFILIAITFSKLLAQWSNDTKLNTPICTEKSDQYGIILVKTKSNGAYIVWIDERNSNPDIYAHKIDSAGFLQWQKNGIPICRANGSQGSIQAVIDRNENLIVTWFDSRSAKTQIFGQKVSPDGNIFWNENGIAFVDSIKGNYQYYSICSDGNDGIFVFWSDCRVYLDVSDLYAQHINSEGKRLWQNDGIVVSNATSSQFRPTAINDGFDGAIVVWNDTRNWSLGYSWDIYAQRINSNGNSLWTYNGIPICAKPRDQAGQKIVTATNNEFIISWNDERAPGTDTWENYAQKINLSGKIIWAENGVQVCPGIYPQASAMLVMDNLGGAILTWTDHRLDVSGRNPRIYVQHMDSSGTQIWQSNGIQLCSNIAGPTTIVSDDSSGAIIVWNDSRNGNDDIFAQRIGGDGTLKWMNNGNPICTASNNQNGAMMVKGGNGSAIIVWCDNRNNSKDIYAQKVLRNGTLPITNNKPQFPSLIFPTNNSYINNTNPKLSWLIPQDADGDQLHFNVEIAKDNNFNTPILGSPFESKNSTVGFYPVPPVAQSSDSCSFTLQFALSDGTYYWRITAWDGKVYGDPSEIRKFTIDASEPYTTGHNPSKNAQDVPRNTNIVVHVLDAVSGVDQSSIIMKVKGIQVTPTITGTSADFTLTYDPPNDFGYMETINVSIDAQDNAGNQMISDSYSFTTAGEINTAAQAPTLSSPSDNSYINDNTPQLSWFIPVDANGDQLHFKVEIDDDHNWSNIFRTIESKISSTGFFPTPPVNQGTGTMSYVVQSSLSEGNWWWRVAAWDGQVYGSYSAERKFTVDVSKPYTSNHNPAKNATGVPINTNIMVNIQDVLSGVNQSSIVMKINGNIVSPIITGAASNYTLTYNPASDFNYNQTVTVSIDAEDNAGNVMNTDSYIFTTASSIDITAPQIVHSVVSRADSGQNIIIEAILTDNVGVQEGKLYYRQGGKVNYTTSTMSNTSGDIYNAIIPGNYVTDRSLEYYILVTDVSNNSSTFPEENAAINPQVIRVRISNFSNYNPTPASAYRMISIPLGLDRPSPKDVLEDNWGAYNDKKWRLLRYVNSEYLEYTRDNDFDNFEPGRGFWLITKDEKHLRVGSGLTVPVGENFIITLQPGWNQIGNPFTFSVDWKDVIRDRNKVEDNLHGYYGEKNEKEGYRAVTRLEPWEGYFIKNLDSNPTNIEIPPIEASGQLAKKSSNLLSLNRFQSEEWGVQITAECDRYIDIDNYIGCLLDANNERDLHDFSEPPFFLEYVSLYFPHKDWNVYPGLYTSDFRSVKLEGDYWDFCVKTNVLNSEIILTLQDIHNLPSGWNILLLDKTSQATIDFLEKKKYTFFMNKAEDVREFRIFVGAKKFIDKNNLEITEIPEQYELMQNYPNPFNSETQIKYFLPISGSVRVIIYSLTGQEIKTLVDSYQGVGSYTVCWDGRSESGNVVSSGIYLIKLESGRFIKTRKMILTK